jgi:DNA-binding FadR family transcriptional regulator
MRLASIKRTRLTESVTDQLMEMLRSGDWRPGAKLPSERELRLQLGVGRSSIREALQALIGLGMIAAHAGRGYYVRPMDTGSAPLAGAAPVLAESHSLLDLLEARLLLEPEIAALAAKNATPLDFAALDRAQLRIVSAARNGRAVYRAAAMFHVEFAKASHNAALVQMVGSLVSVMAYWGRVFERAPNRAQEEVRLHRELLDCLKNQDPAAMRRKMQEHILVTRQALMVYLERSEKARHPRPVSQRSARGG